eukprot:5365627-Pyramimonas_sp.AAC.1
MVSVVCFCVAIPSTSITVMLWFSMATLNSDRLPPLIKRSRYVFPAVTCVVKYPGQRLESHEGGWYEG